MKHPFLIVWYLIIGSAIAAAADFATETLEATFKLFSKDSTATCFFVRRDEPDQALYLVTAAHVLEKVKGDTAVVALREAGADGSYQRRDHTISIRRDGKPLCVKMEYEERTIHHPLGLGTVLHAQFIRDTIEQAAKQDAADSR